MGIEINGFPKDQWELQGGEGIAGKLILSTAELTVVDGDILGRIDFQAPLESSGTDAILVGASIYAEAEDTFAADNNETAIVFATGNSGTATEKMRLTAAAAGNLLFPNQFVVQWKDSGGTANNIIAFNGSDQLVFGDGVTSSSAMRLISGDLSIGGINPTGKFHANQASTTGAKPVMVLNQADVDEDYFKFIGTSDTNVDRALVDAADFTTPGSIVGWLKINIQDDQGTNPITDGDYYIPFYGAPSA